MFMTSLILIVIFGIGFALFATQNTASVTVQLASYVFNLSLYIVVFGALLVGLLISWVISTVDSVANWITLSGRESQLHQTQRTVENLENRIHELELENTQLKTRAGFRPIHEREVHDKEIMVERSDSEIQQRSQNFFDRLKHNLNL